VSWNALFVLLVRYEFGLGCILPLHLGHFLELILDGNVLVGELELVLCNRGQRKRYVGLSCRIRCQLFAFAGNKGRFDEAGLMLLKIRFRYLKD